MDLARSARSVGLLRGRQVRLARHRRGMHTTRATLSATTPLNTPPKGEDLQLTGELGWPTSFEERYQLLRLIGSGTHGCVYEAFDGVTGSTCAVKVMGKERKSCSRRRTLRRLRREAALLAHCSTVGAGVDNVARLQGVYEKESYVYLVLERVAGGDLDALVRSRGPLPEATAACLAYECLKVLAACHGGPELRIVHGDVKPANFMLVAPYGAGADLGRVHRGPGAGVLKAVDFGCSGVLLPERGHVLTRRSGTPVFMSPEVWGKRYAAPADLWSLGVSLFFLLTGRLPFWPTLAAARSQSIEQVRDAICDPGVAPPLRMGEGPWAASRGGGSVSGGAGDGNSSVAVSPECLELLAALLDRDAEARPTAEEAMRHAWFDRFSA